MTLDESISINCDFTMMLVRRDYDRAQSMKYCCNIMLLCHDSPLAGADAPDNKQVLSLAH